SRRLSRHAKPAQQRRERLLGRALALGFRRLFLPLHGRWRRLIRLQEKFVDGLLTPARPVVRTRARRSAPARSRVFPPAMTMLRALAARRTLVAPCAVATRGRRHMKRVHFERTFDELLDVGKLLA